MRDLRIFDLSNDGYLVGAWLFVATFGTATDRALIGFDWYDGTNEFTTHFFFLRFTGVAGLIPVIAVLLLIHYFKSH